MMKCYLSSLTKCANLIFRYNLNSDPLPGSLCSITLPPFLITCCFTKCSPMPEPSVLPAMRKYFENTYSCSFCAMPIPLSFTGSTIKSSSRSVATTTTGGWPGILYFSALPTKLYKILRNTRCGNVMWRTIKWHLIAAPALSIVIA